MRPLHRRTTATLAAVTGQSGIARGADPRPVLLQTIGDCEGIGRGVPIGWQQVSAELHHIRTAGVMFLLAPRQLWRRLRECGRSGG